VVVLVSGVGVNIVAAILTFTIVLSLYGFLVPTLTIESVQPKSPAAVAGIKPGDEVTAIDGQRLAGWTELTSALAKRKPGETVTLAYRRGGVAMASTLVLATREDGSALIGIVSHSVNRPESPITAFVDSLKLTGAVFAAIAAFFGSVIHPHQFVQQLQGARSVIGISTMVRDAAETGPLDYAWLVALLSLSLGAMNVLPVPPLDGGKIALEIIERIAGRPIKREIAYAVSAVGVALLFSLIGYLMYADIVRLVTNKG
jgi:regulator of sigma E protease